MVELSCAECTAEVKVAMSQQEVQVERGDRPGVICGAFIHNVRAAPTAVRHPLDALVARTLRLRARMSNQHAKPQSGRSVQMVFGSWLIPAHQQRLNFNFFYQACWISSQKRASVFLRGHILGVVPPERTDNSLP